MNDIDGVNLAAVDLNLLVALDALLQEEHVGAAARTIGLSQPAMSHALRRLRQLLGYPLLVRAGAQMQRTERAEALRQPLREALQAIAGVLRPAGFDPGTTTRRLCIMMSDYAGCSSYTLAEPQTPPIDAVTPGPPELALVCVLRPHTLGWALTSAVRDNGYLVGATEGPSYFCYFAEPRTHKIEVSVSDAQSVTAELLSGRHYYLHHEINMGPDALLWIEESPAQELIGECTYEVIVGVPGDQKLPGDKPTVPAQSARKMMPRRRSRRTTRGPTGRRWWR